MTEFKKTKPQLQKKEVYKVIFPNTPYQERKIRDLMTYLSVPLNQFLAFQKLHKHKEDELIALCTALRERQFFKQFETTLNKVVALQQQSTTRDSDYHYRNYRLEQERYYASTQRGRALETNLIAVTHSLDISYFTNRLRQSCYMLSHQSMYKTEYDFTLVAHILEEVKRKNLLHIPAISIYYHCYLALVNPDEVHHFKSFQQQLIAHSELFPFSERKDIYLLAINIAIKRYNQGYRDIVGSLLELYQSGIDQKILLTNNILSRFTYKNIVALVSTQKRFEWGASFLNDYTPLLDAEYREVTYQYNLAKLYCEKKEYDEALKYLFLTANSDDVYINIDTKILLSRIYFEQDNFDAQMALMESFKKILNRKKEILGYHYTTYKNFLNCMYKLSLLPPFDQKERTSLFEEVTNTQPLPDKHWFLAQLGKG